MAKAKYHPGVYPKGNTSEKKFAENYAINFSGKWSILHNVRIHDPQKTHDITNTEVDFLFLNSEVGFVQIEVKGSGYSLEEGQWFRREGNNKKRLPKSPVESLYSKEQKIIAVFKEIAQIQKSNYGEMYIPIISLIYWSDNYREDLLNPELSINNSIFANDPFMASPEDFEGYLIKRYREKREGKGIRGENDLGKEFIDLATEIFRPYQESRSLKAVSGRTSDEITTATEEQIATYKSITNNDKRRYFISGPPGSGKTILAVALAKEKAQEDKKVLFMCFNRALADNLKDKLKDYTNIEVISMWKYFISMGLHWKEEVHDQELGNIELEKLPPHKSAKWIKRFLENNLDKGIDQFNYDCLIIDEGQDFSELYWEYFEMLVEGREGEWYLFYDINQSLTHPEWHTPITKLPVSELYLTMILRCTEDISQKVQKVIKGPVYRNGIVGIEPNLLQAKDSSWDSSLDELKTLLKELLTIQKYSPKQITALVPHGKDIHKIKNKEFSEGKSIESLGINISSIFQFKGLENEVVIIVIPNLESLEETYVLNPLGLAYVGFSRAKSLLYVVCDKKVQDKTNWYK